jgi:hypothetical protein
VLDLPRSNSRARRSRADWARRLPLAAVVVVLGGGGVLFSLAQVVAKTNPGRAIRFAPYDGGVIAAYAASLAGVDANDADRVRADDLARKALRKDPTAVVAVSTLAMNAQIRGDTTAARRLFAYAQKLSRRNLYTQLWSIEDSVGRGDIPEALQWYDVTLRTKPAMSEVLYPVLAGATTDPAIRSPLIRTLAGNPAWAESFLNHLAGSGTDPQAVTALFRGLRRAGVAIPEPAHTGAINALLSSGKFDQAWGYYASIRPGVDRRRSRDPRFLAVLGTPSLLDWVPVNDAGVASSIQREGGAGLFEFSAPATVGGPLLQQVQMLPPGRFRLSGHSLDIAADGQALPYWSLTCRGSGLELNRVIVPNSAQNKGEFAGELNVPAGCPVQMLTLFAGPSDAVGGISGRLDRVELVPAQ